MANKIEGGCLCGAFRYKSDAEPLFSVNCHCRDCQMTTGSTHLPVVGIPSATMSHIGDITWHETTPDRDGTARRAFCPTCGTPVFGQADGADVMFVHVITLDDPSWFAPQMDIYESSAQHWDRFDDALPRFPKMQPMGD